MKKIFNFVKNNGILFLVAFWLIDFVVGLITFNPTDKTTGYIKNLILGVDMLWFFVLIDAYITSKIIKYLHEENKLLNKKVDYLFDFIQKAIEKVTSEEEKEDKHAEQSEQQES